MVARVTDDSKIGIGHLQSLFWSALDAVRKADRTPERQVIVKQVPGTRYGVGFSTDTEGPASILLVFTLEPHLYATALTRCLLMAMLQNLRHLFAENVTTRSIDVVLDNVQAEVTAYQLTVYTLPSQPDMAHVMIAEGLDSFFYEMSVHSAMLRELAESVRDRVAQRPLGRPKLGRLPSPRLEPLTVQGAIGWAYLED